MPGQKRATEAPRTYFRACKVSKFLGVWPQPPPPAQSISRPHFMYLPWAPPILSAVYCLRPNSVWVICCGLLAKSLRVIGLELGPGVALGVMWCLQWYGKCVQRITYEYSIDDITATWTAVKKANPILDTGNYWVDTRALLLLWSWCA